MLCQILVAGREVVLVSDAYHGALVAQNGYIRVGHIYGNFHIIVGLYDHAGLGVDFHNAGAILIMYLAVIGSGALRPGQRLDAVNKGVDDAQWIEEPTRRVLTLVGHLSDLRLDLHGDGAVAVVLNYNSQHIIGSQRRGD